MKKNINFYKVFSSVCQGGILLCSIIILFGCNDATMSGIKAIGANITPIEQIDRKQTDQVIYVEGKVEKVVPLLEGKRLYQLNDSSGKIWVLANKTNFRIGEKVVVKGKIKYKDIPINKQDFGDLYIEEES
ncbi:MAG: hypothetical protein AAF316_09465 [Cyanobacteria bacterium P01_A01_bin.80]